MNRRMILMTSAGFLSGSLAEAQYSSRVFHDSGLPGEIYAQNCAFAGDVDADGVGDILIGTQNASQGGISHSGEARVISGATGAILHVYVGTFVSQNVGLSIAPAFDVDHDAHDDFMVYTGGLDPVTGTPSNVTVYSGATGLPLRFYRDTGGAWAYVGLSENALAPAGDVDADGTVDSLLGAPQAAPSGTVTGALHVVSGATGGVLYSWLGNGNHELFGYSVSSAGDVNADGRDDVIVSAIFDDDYGLDAGSATIFDAATGLSLRVLSGNTTNEIFGVDVAGLGDVDGDGRSDVAVGTGVLGSNVRTYSSSNWTVLHKVTGAPATYFGSTLAAAGDQNGDGRGDLLIGAVNSSPLGQYSGSVFLHSGSNGALLRSFHGNGPLERFGSVVAGGGDTNSDGKPDLLVGAPGNGMGSLPGAAYLFESACQTLYGYGYGCPGSGGFIPRLEVTGCVATGTGSLSFSLTDCYGGQLSVLVAGFGPTWYGLGHGCPLLVLPSAVPASFAFLGGVGPGAGSATASIQVDAIQIPFDVFVQAFVGDAVPGGFTASNAIVIGKPGS